MPFSTRVHPTRVSSVRVPRDRACSSSCASGVHPLPRGGRHLPMLTHLRRAPHSPESLLYCTAAVCTAAFASACTQSAHRAPDAFPPPRLHAGVHAPLLGDQRIRLPKIVCALWWPLSGGGAALLCLIRCMASRSGCAGGRQGQHGAAGSGRCPKKKAEAKAARQPTRHELRATSRAAERTPLARRNGRASRRARAREVCLK